MVTVSVIIPAYQEADNLAILLPKLTDVMKRSADRFEIIVADSNPPLDNTREICSRFSDVKYIQRQGGNLYGNAIRSGIQAVQYDLTVVMDADGSHSPDELPAMLKEAKKSDIVIASRYTKGGKTNNPLILIAMSLFVNIVYRIFLNINVRDISNSFRIYHSEKLKSLSLNSNNFDIVEEILIKLTNTYPGTVIRELPTYFDKRKYGNSKRNLIKFAISYAVSIYRLMKLKYNTGK
ncbi:MAG: glycosyltransferase [Lentisphaeria bacterium]|nr:glycosyltransferase [Lentisphaeria bacterium]